MALEKIDVVNLNSKKSSTTDSQGNFSIEAKVGDELFVLSNESFTKTFDIAFYKVKTFEPFPPSKVILKGSPLYKEDFKIEKLIINLSKKPIELEEVTINKVEKISIKVSPEEIRMAKIAKFENSPKVLGVYTGEMPYGVDFVGLYKKIFKSNKKKDKEETPKFASFKEYALSIFDLKEFFYIKLNLKPEELDLFMAYCENGITYREIMKNGNPLETMGFLISKNEEFKKLGR